MSLVMLRGTVFSRSTAYVGLVAHVFQLGFFIALALAPAPALLALPLSIAALFRLARYVLIARRLVQLASDSPGEEQFTGHN